jgi:hypothetical protein
VADDPELAAFAEASSYERGELLMHPQPHLLSRFAFPPGVGGRRRDAPTEALAWMRLAHAVHRDAEVLEREARPIRMADYARAGYARALDALLDADPEADEAQEAE